MGKRNRLRKQAIIEGKEKPIAPKKVKLKPRNNSLAIIELMKIMGRLGRLG